MAHTASSVSHRRDEYNILKEANFTDNGIREIGFGSSDGGEVDEYIAIGCVGIS